MLKIRLTEEEIARRYGEQKMRCPTHLSIGQEAVPAVLSQFLSNEDLVVSTHRGHAHYLAKNGDLKKMIAELYGKKSGCSAGKGGSMHLIDLGVGFMGTSAIVGNSIPIGVGLALQQSMAKSDYISVVYLGDGAIEEGVFYESINFAVTKKLRVIFVCENNLYSVYSPLKVRQPADRPISNIAKAIGAMSLTCDGNDIFKLRKTFGDAIALTKSSDTPVFIECATYRWLEHCGPNYDNDLNYREQSEFDYWKNKDPIIKAAEQCCLSDYDLNVIKTELRQEIDEAFDFAENSPFPPQEDLFMGEFG
jgi:TPP-dependent pyruvate/acetoin dehydrogenase alpha subunit